MTKFIVNSINIISSWGYNLKTNVDCTICRCSLDTASLYNQDKGIDSKIIIGICGHTFHEECINPWINKNTNCPICSLKWVTSKIINNLDNINSKNSMNYNPELLVPPVVSINSQFTNSSNFQIPPTIEEAYLLSGLSNPNMSPSININSHLTGSTNFQVSVNPNLFNQ
jgi:hypothetical protein